jgi:hypothetical protein
MATSNWKCGPTPLTAKRDLYVQLLSQGMNNSTACRQVGVNRKTGQRWRLRRVVKKRPEERRVSLRPDLTDGVGRPDQDGNRGHWEGNLITGALNQSEIGTLVERVTRFTILVHFVGTHDAEQLRDSMTAIFHRLPPSMRRSLTWRDRLVKHSSDQTRPVTRPYVVRPLGVEPRTCGLRVPRHPSAECCAVRKTGLSSRTQSRECCRIRHSPGSLSPS